VQSTFSKTSTRLSRDYRARRVSSAARWVARFHGAHPLRPATSTYRSAFSSDSGTASAGPLAPRHRPPRATPSYRREPRRATSLDRFHSRRVKRPELPRSEMPSIVREPEGPLRPRRLSPRDSSQRRFTRRGLRHFGLQPDSLSAAATTKRAPSKTFPTDFCNQPRRPGTPDERFENLTPFPAFHAKWPPPGGL